MFDWLSSPEVWIALGTLVALEVVLGVDNIIFISILSGKLPEHSVRKLGRSALVLLRLVALDSCLRLHGLFH